MPQSKPIRVIKRGQTNRVAEPVAQSAEKEVVEQSRRMKTVISGWVHEHRQRTEEFWQTYTAQLEELGFKPLRASR